MRQVEISRTLVHAELPPVASQAIGARERARDADDPVVEERLQFGRSELISDSLQPGWVVTARKAVGEFGEVEALGSRLTFGPVVAVDPQLQRIREITADLDEAQAKVWVEDVEVVHRHAAIGLVEAELWSVCLGSSAVSHEHFLDLLSDDDGHDPRLGRFVDIVAHAIDLAVIPARPIRRVQVKQRDGINLGEAADGVAETITNPLEQGW